MLLLVTATWQFGRYYRASACNAFRARYCYRKSVHPSVCPSVWLL